MCSIHSSEVEKNSESDELESQVYRELRRVAGAKMSREAPLNTLQATALVHEAWLKLGGDRQPKWKSKAQFYSAAAEAMRRILIDRARKKRTIKHGGDYVRVEVDDISALASGKDGEAELIAVNEALEKLSQFEPREAELVKLRYFVGLTIEEAAVAMGVSKTTANRMWAFAKAWLFEEISAS